MDKDPITFEIIQNSLQAISDEMFAAMRKTAMSAIIYEVLDMGTAITTADGELASSGAGIPAFSAMLDKSVQRILELNSSQGDIEQGDIFIRKAAASTLGDIVQALKSIFKSKSEIRTIGMRHGEKMHETLASKEELARSQDMGDFLRLSMDNRGLNYEKYLSEGEKKLVQLQDYNSVNSKRMTVKEIEALLLGQPEIMSILDK